MKKSYASNSLFASLLIGFFALALLFPMFVQFTHLVLDTEHGHHHLHQPKALNYADKTDSCYILSFKYTSAKWESPEIYSHILNSTILIKNTFLITNLIADKRLLIHTLRAPPLA